VTFSFTGTRKGVTLAQKDALVTLRDQFKPEIARHGCCEGADRNFHLVMLHSATIIGHPCCVEQSLWAGKCGSEFGRIHELPSGSLAVAARKRNEAMVEFCDLLVACPGQYYEEQRSGTWMTIRMAKTRGRRLAIIWPDGRVEWWYQGTKCGGLTIT
jgi:hypothetical protein